MPIVSVQKLEDADKDADSLNKFVNGAETESVKTRLNVEYPTLANAVRQIMETGGFEPFATETALLASVPTVTKKAAKALDTKKVWLWDGTQWNDTGLSEYDLANEFTNKKAKDITDQMKEIRAVDFYTKPANIEDKGFAWCANDADGNILVAVDKNGFFQQNYIYDFHTKPENSILIAVDDNLNIISIPEASGGAYDFSDTPSSAFTPNIQSNKSPYLNYGGFSLQHDYSDDLYTKDVKQLFPNHQTLYAFYDSLINQHPERLSSIVLGQDALGNEIKQYSYTPLLFEDDGTTGWTSEDLLPPKLVITSGVHGTEQDTVLQVAIIVHEILNRPHEIEEAAYLSQFRIVVVPLVNPSGFDLDTRENHNGINLNRNAPAGWSKWANGTSGQSAADQLETQIACSLPILHADAVSFIDCHNFNYGILRSGWFGTMHVETLPVIKSLAMKVQHVARKDFPYLNNRPVRVAQNAAGTIARDWQITNSKKGYLIETPLLGGTRPLFENRQFGLFVLRQGFSMILKNESGV